MFSIGRTKAERLKYELAWLVVEAVKLNCTTLKQALNILAKQQWPVVERKPWAITFKYGKECHEVVTICIGRATSGHYTRRRLTDWHQEYYIYI